MSPTKSLERGAGAFIRRYRPTDFDEVSEVCLRTAHRGGDATGLYSNDDLMPDIFARPYLLLEPDFAFVVDDGQRVNGYILCAPDTAHFVARYRSEWLPTFLRKYEHSSPPRTRDELIRHLGFTPERMLIPELHEYPAHMHVDLLPAYQRCGFGRALIDKLLAALRTRGVDGLHLTMDPENVEARAFYDRLGFRELASSTTQSPALAMKVSPDGDT